MILKAMMAIRGMVQILCALKLIGPFLLSYVQGQPVVDGLDSFCRWNFKTDGCPAYESETYLCARFSCPEGQEYHCARAQNGSVIQMCAVPKYCKKGEHPKLNLKYGAYCETCPPESFQSRGEFSYKFSDCESTKSKCYGEDHEIECPGYATPSTDRMCRCNVREGYILSHYKNKKHSPCCSKLHDNCDCIQAERQCPVEQERLIDYSCGYVCPVGEHRTAMSDECKKGPVSGSDTVQPPVLTTTSAPTGVGSTGSTKEPTSGNEDSGNLPAGLFSLIVGAAVFIVIIVVLIACHVIGTCNGKPSTNGHIPSEPVELTLQIEKECNDNVDSKESEHLLKQAPAPVSNVSVVHKYKADKIVVVSDAGQVNVGENGRPVYVSQGTTDQTSDTSSTGSDDSRSTTPRERAQRGHQSQIRKEGVGAVPFDEQPHGEHQPQISTFPVQETDPPTEAFSHLTAGHTVPKNSFPSTSKQNRNSLSLFSEPNPSMMDSVNPSMDVVWNEETAVKVVGNDLDEEETDLKGPYIGNDETAVKVVGNDSDEETDLKIPHGSGPPKQVEDLGVAGKVQTVPVVVHVPSGAMLSWSLLDSPKKLSCDSESTEKKVPWEQNTDTKSFEETCEKVPYQSTSHSACTGCKKCSQPSFENQTLSHITNTCQGNTSSLKGCGETEADSS